MSYVSSTFPIRTHETLRRMAPEYFAKPPQRRPGESRTALGKLLITPQQSTLFVVRVTSRVKVDRLSWKWRGATRYLSHADYYRAAARDYRVAEIRWSDGFVTELSRHADRAFANAMLIALHAQR